LPDVPINTQLEVHARPAQSRDILRPWDEGAYACRPPEGFATGPRQTFRASFELCSAIGQVQTNSDVRDFTCFVKAQNKLHFVVELPWVPTHVNGVLHGQTPVRFGEKNRSGLAGVPKLIRMCRVGSDGAPHGHG